jgi:hypothetical protein
MLGAMLLMVGQSVGWAQKPATRVEEVEWTWEIRPAHPDAKLPNVLLLGDSITRNYFPDATKALDGVANVYLMATSASVGDPRLERQIDEFASCQGVSFSVVHFNNGMHGWEYSEEEYRAAFGSLVKEMHAIAPQAKLIWATITAVKADKEPGPTNARVAARNAMAEAALKGSGIAVDDQYSLMMKHTDLYKDSVHFNEQGAALQGKQVAEEIRRALGVAAN